MMCLIYILSMIMSIITIINIIHIVDASITHPNANIQHAFPHKNLKSQTHVKVSKFKFRSAPGNRSESNPIQRIGPKQVKQQFVESEYLFLYFFCGYGNMPSCFTGKLWSYSSSALQAMPMPPAVPLIRRPKPSSRTADKS